MASLDAINARILQELQADGRISNQELAGRVGLSPSACLRRVQELERTGIIKGYRAVLDPVALGKPFLAIIAIGLNDHSQASQRGFEAAMAAAPAVRECHTVTGTVEYFIRVEVEDIAAFNRFHVEVLGPLRQVTSIVSYVVRASSKDERG